jgi:hypothetical protein
MDRFCIFSGLRGWEKSLVFILTLSFMYFVAVIGSVIFSWLGMFLFFCGVWLKPVQDKFDAIDKKCKKKKNVGKDGDVI